MTLRLSETYADNACLMEAADETSPIDVSVVLKGHRCIHLLSEINKVPGSYLKICLSQCILIGWRDASQKSALPDLGEWLKKTMFASDVQCGNSPENSRICPASDQLIAHTSVKGVRHFFANPPAERVNSTLEQQDPILNWWEMTFLLSKYGYLKVKFCTVPATARKVTWLTAVMTMPAVAKDNQSKRSVWPRCSK